MDLLAFLGGVLSEVFLFSRGEWDRHGKSIVKGFSVLSVSSICLLTTVLGFPLGTSIKNTISLTIAVLSGLFGSMIVYRLFFHPLKSFPGPKGARVTAFWMLWQNVPDLRFYVKLRSLHNDYGDFVRIRPREISICHPDAVVDIYGPINKMRKAEFYEQLHPHQNLQLSRDPAFHHQKRRHWDRAFSKKALLEYQPKLRRHYTTLMDILTNRVASKESIDATELFMDLAFDIVSDLTFGKSFDKLSTGIPNPIIDEFLREKKGVGFILQMMWLLHLSKALPAVDSRLQEWVRWYDRELAERKEMVVHSADFYTYLSQADNFERDGAYEAQLAIIAGADTVAVVLSNMCYLICRYPHYQAELYAELVTLPLNGVIIDDQHLSGLPVLSGVINEALRLYPPTPSGLQRLTPPEGATIAGRYIAGEMVVSVPTYALQRDKRAFVKPNDFIPERWYSQPELVLRKDAFIPFSYGPYNCAGRPLAMMEIRMILAMLIRRFEISFAPGKEAECQKFIGDQADCFALHIHSLPLVLKERRGRP
ncbi:cytochrome P450 [Massariosphaeria phaeospora]|uniref:Cytochrome P450 n=1 Tax=Massariosphaeria phaeospora TaxID=100035 RepID=A0A7C8I9T9_9PLEO|nr:cytochrome P450 [Massariosphaeria phaeospora]